MKNLLEERFIVSGLDPIASHISHIRHLVSPSSLSKVLRENHNLTNNESKNISTSVSSYIEQALFFRESWLTAPTRIKPVLQYYSYLNLASAIVRIYRPPNWESYKKHGAEDMTHKLKKKLTLASEVVKLKKGAIPLFHSVISNTELSSEPLTIKTLLSSIPMLHAELRDYFDIRSDQVFVSHRISSNKHGHRSKFFFQLPQGSKNTLPVKKIQKFVSGIEENYILSSNQKTEITFESKQLWSLGNIDRARKIHSQTLTKYVNYGTQRVYHDAGVFYYWEIPKRTELIPLMTSTLIFSFVMSSLSRYRADLLSKSEASELNLLFEIFSQEADCYMIPAFRNLLFRETALIDRHVHL